MNEIKFFLKFGEREYLERFQKGNLFFSNAQTFRYYEENLFIKGQGDHLEGGSMITASNMTMIDNNSNEPVFTGVRVNVIYYFKPANLLPVFCLFACFEKDCLVKDDGTLSIELSEDIKQNIIAHFPKADTVAIIKKPQQFIDDVRSTIVTECKSDLINYFHLLGFDSEQGRANDLSYFKYLSQGAPPNKENERLCYSIKSKDIYRSLLCKDLFFKKEQEYRFILPQMNITKSREFPVRLNESIELQDLSYFFSQKTNLKIDRQEALYS